MPSVMFKMIWDIVFGESVMLVSWWLNITQFVTFWLHILFLVWSVKSCDMWIACDLHLHDRVAAISQP